MNDRCARCESENDLVSLRMEAFYNNRPLPVHFTADYALVCFCKRCDAALEKAIKRFMEEAE